MSHSCEFDSFEPCGKQANYLLTWYGQNAEFQAWLCEEHLKGATKYLKDRGIHYEYEEEEIKVIFT